jgi:plasmid stabilization system protein ParE
MIRHRLSVVLYQNAELQNSSLIEMATLLNAILAARPPTASSSILPPAPVRPLGGAGIVTPLARGAAPARGGARALPANIAPPADVPRRGRPDKAERAKEERRIGKERILAFAETKPSRRAVREFFMNRISELKDE